MKVDRFAILTYIDPGHLLNASTDQHGLPGNWKSVIPGADEIVSVVSLPCGWKEDVGPEAFRLLVSYRMRVTT